MEQALKRQAVLGRMKDIRNVEWFKTKCFNWNILGSFCQIKAVLSIIDDGDVARGLFLESPKPNFSKIIKNVFHLLENCISANNAIPYFILVNSTHSFYIASKALAL